MKILFQFKRLETVVIAGFSVSMLSAFLTAKFGIMVLVLIALALVASLHWEQHHEL